MPPATSGISAHCPQLGRIARDKFDAREFALNLLQSGAPATVPPAFGKVAELSYQIAPVGPLKLPPNLQYIVRLTGGALAIQTPGRRVPRALVLGLRSSVSF